MHRCYLPVPDLTEGPLLVEGEEAHHALRVLRMRAGEECEVFNGFGQAVRARITYTSGSHMQLEVLEELPLLPSVAGITLAFAIPKGTLVDLIVQKAVELGAQRIIPLITERTIVRITPQEAPAKAEKWRRTVLEACKQCGVRDLPVLEEPQPYAAFLQRADVPTLRVQCALVPHARPLREVLEPARAAGCREVILLIGPEGDFSPAEYAAAEAAGYAPASLGPIVLRVETACFHALAAARYALDEGRSSKDEV